MGCCIRSFAVILSVLTIVSYVFFGLITNSITNYWHVFLLCGIPVFSGTMLILGAITTASIILSIYLFADSIRAGLNIGCFIFSLVVVIWRKESLVERMLNMEGLHRFLRNHESDFKDVKVFDYMHYFLIILCVFSFLEIVNTVLMLSLGRSIKQSANRKLGASKAF
uniref:7TM GPCR serpentine receptor class x (Srx) domain-containing protein n=1 Tax=Panagrellus redivivus TaxID=6233 RepID=A0A7E4UQD2_PANRE